MAKKFCWDCLRISHIPILKKYINCRYCRGFKHEHSGYEKDPNNKPIKIWPFYIHGPLRMFIENIKNGER